MVNAVPVDTTVVSIFVVPVIDQNFCYIVFCEIIVFLTFAFVAYHESTTIPPPGVTIQDLSGK